MFQRTSLNQIPSSRMSEGTWAPPVDLRSTESQTCTMGSCVGTCPKARALIGNNSRYVDGTPRWFLISPPLPGVTILKALQSLVVLGQSFTVVNSVWSLGTGDGATGLEVDGKSVHWNFLNVNDQAIQGLGYWVQVTLTQGGTTGGGAGSPTGGGGGGGGGSPTGVVGGGGGGGGAGSPTGVVGGGGAGSPTGVVGGGGAGSPTGVVGGGGAGSPTGGVGSPTGGVGSPSAPPPVKYQGKPTGSWTQSKCGSPWYSWSGGSCALTQQGNCKFYTQAIKSVGSSPLAVYPLYLALAKALAVSKWVQWAAGRIGTLPSSSIEDTLKSNNTPSSIEDTLKSNNTQVNYSTTISVEFFASTTKTMSFTGPNNEAVFDCPEVIGICNTAPAIKWDPGTPPHLLPELSVGLDGLYTRVGSVWQLTSQTMQARLLSENYHYVPTDIDPSNNPKFLTNQTSLSSKVVYVRKMMPIWSELIQTGTTLEKWLQATKTNQSVSSLPSAGSSPPFTECLIPVTNPTFASILVLDVVTGSMQLWYGQDQISYPSTATNVSNVPTGVFNPNAVVNASKASQFSSQGLSPEKLIEKLVPLMQGPAYEVTNNLLMNKRQQGIYCGSNSKIEADDYFSDLAWTYNSADTATSTVSSVPLPFPAEISNSAPVAFPFSMDLYASIQQNALTQFPKWMGWTSPLPEVKLPDYPTSLSFTMSCTAADDIGAIGFQDPFNPPVSILQGTYYPVYFNNAPVTVTGSVGGVCYSSNLPSTPGYTPCGMPPGYQGSNSNLWEGAGSYWQQSGSTINSGFPIYMKVTGTYAQMNGGVTGGGQSTRPPYGSGIIYLWLGYVPIEVGKSLPCPYKTIGPLPATSGVEYDGGKFQALRWIFSFVPPAGALTELGNQSSIFAQIEALPGLGANSSTSAAGALPNFILAMSEPVDPITDKSGILDKLPDYSWYIPGASGCPPDIPADLMTNPSTGLYQMGVTVYEKSLGKIPSAKLTVGTSSPAGACAGAGSGPAAAAGAGAGSQPPSAGTGTQPPSAGTGTQPPTAGTGTQPPSTGTGTSAAPAGTCMYGGAGC